MGKWQRVLYQPGIGLLPDGGRVTACKEHRELAREVLKEGMVLLKNEGGLLPLPQGSRIALFGTAVFDYVKGGGGSGDVTEEYATNLYEGFQKLSGAVRIQEELADFYRDNVKKQHEAGVEPGKTEEPEVPDELCRRARAFTDTALIAICRFSGEGWDRQREDFYLTDGEKALIRRVEDYFDRIAVVLNVGGVIDTSWFASEEKISSALLMWQGGMEGGLAAAELLCGRGNPSGRLADTFARELDDYPSTETFYENDKYVNYKEDIYVGYRYFETIPGAAEKVVYPFGYGLSYTDFEWKVCAAEETGQRFRIQADVTNVGNMAGKEVLQLYGSAPQGKLGKAARHLLAFQKTALLEPGQTQRLTLSFPLADMSSFDDLGKIQKSAYVLEAGEYRFYLGENVRAAAHLESLDYTLGEDQIVGQLSARLTPTSLEERLLADGSMEPLPLSEPNDPNAHGLDAQDKEALDGLKPAVRHVEGTYCFLKNLYKEGVRPLIEVAEGKMTIEEFLAQMTDEEVAHLLGGQPNTGVANTFGWGNMPEYGIPNCMTADGPAGLRIEPACGINTTSWPCSTLLACTWNPELAYREGEAGAKEVKENNIAAWLTPAINIHRNPLCGRNFEYYSEDPALTGVMASAMVKGIQSQRIGATVKHFAMNNKETDRKNSDSRVSERAAREIYLKAFERIVKEAKPWAIMSSYNIINGHRASENRDLLEGILREEWGFDGMVTTDWWTLGEHYKEVKAGNDMKMGCGFPERLLEALDRGLLTREEMEACAARVLQFILKLD